MVVSIIGVLTALAIPQFSTFIAKAKQAEAKTNLTSYHSLQAAYIAENGVKSLDFSELNCQGSLTPSPQFCITLTGRYNYHIDMIAGSLWSFTAFAKNNDLIVKSCGNRDAWSITDNRAVTNIYNCITRSGLPIPF